MTKKREGSFDFAQDDKLWGIGDDKFGGVRDGNFYAGYTPTPGVFLQEWQGKDLGALWLVRVAAAGLKVVLFSWVCGASVRVAGEGLSEVRLTVDS
jgi:hypothetical protein